MSRNVDIYAGPLSDEDREYLLARGRFVDISRNEAAFPREGSGTSEGTRVPDPADEAGSDDDSGQEDTGPAKYSEEWFDTVTVAVLQEELKAKGLPVSGKRDELVDRLYEKLIDDGVLKDEDEE